MRLTLLAIGRAKRDPASALYAAYADRLAPLPFGRPILREFEVRRAGPDAQRIAEEGDLLLQAVPAGAAAVVLDEQGQHLTSARFAERLGHWRDTGIADLAVLIGGADGHGAAVRHRADLLLAFGAMTWPHMMVRAMAAEQLYRAQMILAGHPYHRA